MSVGGQGTGWLQVLGYGHHTKSFMYTNSSDSLEDEMIGHEVKINLARAK